MSEAIPNPDDDGLPGMAGGSKLFHVYEDDLAELERILPDILSNPSLEIHFAARQRTQVRRVKDILSNIRWDYGPHENIEEIPA